MQRVLQSGFNAVPARVDEVQLVEEDVEGHECAGHWDQHRGEQELIEEPGAAKGKSGKGVRGQRRQRNDPQHDHEGVEQ